jgi:hypothetical protein
MAIVFRKLFYSCCSVITFMGILTAVIIWATDSELLSVPFIVSLSTVTLPHRKPASAGTSRENRPGVREIENDRGSRNENFEDLSEIWSSHNGDYDENCLLACDAVQSGRRTYVLDKPAALIIKVDYL